MKIKYLVMDVDGTLTDGKINIGTNGEVFKSFDVKDGYGIYSILPSYGIVPIIITGRESLIVSYRAKELKINEIHQGVSDKLAQLRAILRDEAGLNTVAYIGDDLNDMEVMMAIRMAGGYTGCPADSATVVKDIVSYVCHSKGGNGAVREFIDKIITL